MEGGSCKRETRYCFIDILALWHPVVVSYMLFYLLQRMDVAAHNPFACFKSDASQYGSSRLLRFKSTLIVNFHQLTDTNSIDIIIISSFMNIALREELE